MSLSTDRDFADEVDLLYGDDYTEPDDMHGERSEEAPRNLMKLVRNYSDKVDWRERNTQLAAGCSLCSIITGIVCFILAIFLYVTLGFIFVSLVTSNAVVTSTSSFGYDVWHTNIDNASPPMYECYNFFNLTNQAEVEQGGMPVYEEKGPYCYQIFKEKINVDWLDDGNQVTHNTWIYYIYAPEVSFGNDPYTDLMTNISPGYMGVLATAKGELQMMVGFTGPSISFNIDWLCTVFVRHVEVDNIADNLSDQQCVLSGCEGCGGRNPDNCSLEEEFYTTWANATVPPSDDWNGMILGYNGLASGISMESAVQLFDSKIEYSLLSTKRASLELWFNATTTDVVGPEWLPKEIDVSQDALQFITSQFNITDNQAQMVANWLVSQFFPIIVDPALVSEYSAKDPGVKEVSDLGWLQWGTCDVQRSGAGSLFKAGGCPEFGCFFLGILGSFSVEESKQLIQLPSGLANMRQGGIFFEDLAEAALKPCPGTNCSSCTGCTSMTYSCDAKGFGNSCYYNSTAGDCFNSDTSQPDSSACTLESSTSDCDIPVNGTVSCEQCAWGDYAAPHDYIIRAHECTTCSTGCDACTKCDLCTDYPSDECDNGEYWDEITGTWGLEYDDLLNFLVYWAYATEEYSIKYLAKVMDHGGGLFMTRTMNEWMFRPLNPLVAIANPANPNVDCQVANQTSPEVASALPRSVLYTGKDDLSQLAYYVSFGNLTSFNPPFVAEEVPIVGNDGYGQFEPFQDENDINELFVFDGSYLRSIELVKTMEVEYRGVKMNRFSISNSTWAVDPIYYSFIPGFANITAFKYGSPIFLSNPHWAGVGEEWTSKAIGVAENQDWSIDWSVIDVEPLTGTVMHVNDSLQVNVFVNEPHWFNLYNRNVTTGLFYPIMWAREEVVISNFDHLILDGLLSVQWWQRASFGICVFSGVVLLVLGILVAWHRLGNGPVITEEAQNALLEHLDDFSDDNGL